MGVTTETAESKPSRKIGTYISEPFSVDVSSLSKPRGGFKEAADFQFSSMTIGQARATDYSVATVIKAAKAKAPGMKFKVFTDNGRASDQGQTIYARVA